LVKQQLNIKPESPKWDLCQDDIQYTPQQNATYWIYPKLVNRYKILKYSGDADGAVPTLGTQNWIADMGWPVTEKWRPYYITNMYGQQVAGYIEKRGTFTFVTVHGAGHMAPQWKRQETYHAIFNWINDQPI
jgi:carboxypeptidase C (cathepsin A)